MIQVNVEDAVGMVLAHDMTKIIPNVFKGVAFRKGHIIQPSDIEEFKNMGKYHVYVFELSETELHENDAAKRLALAVAGTNVLLSEEKEGKVDLRSKINGRFRLSVPRLAQINEYEGIILATRHQDIVVKAGDLLAGAKIIPLVIQKQMIENIEIFCEQQGKLMEVMPFVPLKVGLLITGSEVYYQRIEDKFAQVLESKIESFGGR
jgi:hypothetical protein